MRVLYWQEPFWPQVGGMPSAADTLLHELRERGYVIEVVTGADFPFWQTLHEGDVDRVVALRQQIAALKRRFNPDLVHLGGIGPSMMFHWQTSGSARVPTIVTLHSSNTLSGTEKTLARMTLESAQWIAACSQSLLDDARRVLPSIQPRSSVIHNGVRRPPIAAAPRPLAPSLLCVGQLERHKGFEHAIGAVAILRARFPDLRLVIAGGGEERRNLEDRAVEAGVDAAVRFTGPVPHDRIYELMKEATLVLIPSLRESFGLVAVEAALMRRTVVATRVGGLPEVVSHGQTGVLIDKPSDEALASAVSDLLADPQGLDRLSMAAERRAAELFSAARCADAYDRLYSRFVSGTLVPDQKAVSR